MILSSFLSDIKKIPIHLKKDGLKADEAIKSLCRNSLIPCWSQDGAGDRKMGRSEECISMATGTSVETWGRENHSFH